MPLRGREEYELGSKALRSVPFPIAASRNCRSRRVCARDVKDTSLSASLSTRHHPKSGFSWLLPVLQGRLGTLLKEKLFRGFLLVIAGCGCTPHSLSVSDLNHQARPNGCDCHKAILAYAPDPFSTAGNVFSRIFASSQRLQVSMYSRSRAMFLSNEGSRRA